MSKITVIVRWDGNTEKLEQTLRSCQKQDPVFGQGCLIVATTDAGHTDQEKEVWKHQYPDICFSEETVVSTEFVTVVDAGEYYEADIFERLPVLLGEHPEENFFLLSNVTPHTVVKKETELAAGRRCVTKAGAIQKLPAGLRGTITRTDLWKKEIDGIPTACAVLSDWDDLTLARQIAENETVLYVKNAYFHGNQVYPDWEALPETWSEEDWYTGRAKRWKQVLDMYGTEPLPLFVQAQLLLELRNCFMANKGNRNTGALSGCSRETFFSVCREVLQYISNDLLTPKETVQEERRLLYPLWSAFMRLKYEGEDWSVKDQKPIVMLDLMEYEQKTWRMDVSVDQFVADRFELKVLCNGQVNVPEQTERFSEAEFFGEPVVKKATFAVKIPVEQLASGGKLSFVLGDGTEQTSLAIASTDYGAKLATMLKQSYWCFGSYMVTQIRNGKEGCTGLLIRRAGKASRMAQELRLMKEILRAPYGSKRMFAVRTLYWLTYPLYGHKNIWVTFDKLYKGGDCGEYFYKYMRTRRADGITPVYVIREDVADYRRFVEEGCRPVAYHSMKQRLLYLHASMIFATHSAVPSFCGFSKWEVRFVQDRIRAVNTCIQHGLSVQDLTVDSNRIINNNKRYYCASKYEIENLSRPAYDYAPEVLRLTGLARYDGLVNRDQKQILIAPTWRAYIAMPPVMGSTRPYNPEFKQTDYFKIFQALLENERLQSAAEEAGYRLQFLLHPVISAQRDDFQVGGNVELLSAAESNYEKLLTEASLMVTDYSGIQFDFAYMRKPVVYFHPPKLPPHYVEGGFFYDTMGFGEICTETEQLVDTLIDYLQSGCALKEFYRGRQDAFFAFDDHENCRRIFEDALEYQKQRKESV